ncbi:MAG: hypothetical protein U1C74_13575, partial [Phenylobacterium sp.]|nr:hypothetical protein [Phenylobacterium sp.]
MRVLRASACVLALGAGSPAIAAGPAGGSSCTGCHGVAGPAAPLEGRPAGDIVTAMAAFRVGERSPTVMDRIAKGFSEA